MKDKTDELCGLLARIKARTAETKAAGIELDHVKESVLDREENKINSARWGAMSGDRKAEDDYMSLLRGRRMLS